jgi:hypothetical protein
VSRFGLNAPPVKKIDQGPDLMQARVAKVTADRLGNVSVELDNGQTWTFNEPDAPLRAGDAVRIRRASFGSFLMAAPGRRTYRVRRVQ